MRRKVRNSRRREDLLFPKSVVRTPKDKNVKARKYGVPFFVAACNLRIVTGPAGTLKEIHF